MGWFNEQIKQRMEMDEEQFQEAMADMAQAAVGKRTYAFQRNGEALSKNAIEEILKFYQIRVQELPSEIKDLNGQLEYLMRPSGIMRRKVELTGNWYEDCVGPLLGTRTDDGSAVALIPKGMTGYDFFDVQSGRRVRVGKQNAKLIDTEATCFYKPFPLRKITAKDLMFYILQSISKWDYTMIGATAIAVTLIGMIIPKVTNLVFSVILESGQMNAFWAAAVLLFSAAVSGVLIGVTKQIVLARLNTKLSVSVQAASMMRVLSLPADFFKKFSSGELSSRIQGINSLCSMLIDTILSTGMAGIFSLLYVAQIVTYAPGLVIPALIILLVTLVFTVISALAQMKLSRKIMEHRAKQNGLEYALLTGIQKIRLSGAEKRAFAKWGKVYQKTVQYMYNPSLFLRINKVIPTGITLAGTVLMYYMAVKTQVSVADYYSFYMAYGMVSAAFMGLASMALTFSNIKPALDMIKPVLETVPEVSIGKKVVTRIFGGIELSNINFRYGEGMPLVIDDMSLKIRSGQYVAIVGRTGCGKSTLMRILLGFETPQQGAVYYDGKDLSTLDLKSLRQHIGVVMQNGKLFSGDIYSNIIISAPRLTVEQAFEAADMAGIGDDIRHMPMGMHTVISEGSGGVSGGQRQRLMIARAIAPKPKILMFDEATSALDNITQKIVSDSLDGLKCTRIVIAHRLSTIRHCDRILVLDGGKIVEDGTYEALIEKKGFFADLVARQQLDGEKI